MRSKFTPTKTGLGLAFAMTWCLAAARPARANFDVGAQAPSWRVGEMLGAAPFTLEDMRGRLILYEFFGTG